jgi:putative hydrolase of the HAD superfamily
MQSGNSIVSSRLRGVVLALDVDGVILDDALGGSAYWKSIFGEKFGVNADLLRTEFFGPAWSGVIRGQIPIESALKEAITALGWTMTVDQVLNSWFEDDYFPDNEVIAAANGWVHQGARLVLVTNQEHRRTEFLRPRLSELLPLSDFIYSAAIGFVKEEREFYTIADTQLGTLGITGAVVFVDDTLENVEAARSHGWRGILFDKSTTWQSTIDHLLQQTAHSLHLP